MPPADILQMSFFMDMADPQDLPVIKDAFCVLVETHLNYEQQAIIAVFKCWRNQKAYENKKEAFTSMQLSFSPEEGGKLFFNAQGIDGARGFLGAKATEFCLQQKLQNARMAYTKKDPT